MIEETNQLYQYWSILFKLAMFLSIIEVTLLLAFNPELRDDPGSDYLEGTPDLVFDIINIFHILLSFFTQEKGGTNLVSKNIIKYFQNFFILDLITTLPHLIWKRYYLYQLKLIRIVRANQLFNAVWIVIY